MVLLIVVWRRQASTNLIDVCKFAFGSRIECRSLQWCFAEGEVETCRRVCSFDNEAYLKIMHLFAMNRGKIMHNEGNRAERMRGTQCTVFSAFEIQAFMAKVSLS